MSGATQEQLNDLLLKKILGSAWTTIEQPPTLEASGSAMTKIPASLIMNQNIPIPAPSDLIINTAYTGTGTRKISTLYPYIQQYTKLLTTTVTPGTCFKDTNISTLDNQLSQAIPFNYDPAGGYSMTVYVNNVSQPSNLWYFDGSSGYLTFFSSIGVTDYPTISFWRYDGTFGLVTGSTGSHGSTGPQGYQGNQGNPGFTGYHGQSIQGHRGSTGSTGPQGDPGQSIQGGQGGRGSDCTSFTSEAAGVAEVVFAVAAAATAAGSATAAEISATAAGVSATAAGVSATAAGVSATAAGSAATAAAGSATGAGDAALSATTYASDYAAKYNTAYFNYTNNPLAGIRMVNQIG